MTRLLRIAPALLALLAFAAPPAAAQTTTTATLSGVVQDEKEAVPNATVTVRNVRPTTRARRRPTPTGATASATSPSAPTR